MSQLVRPVPRVALALLGLVLSVATGLADKVTLRNGRVQEGQIESEDDKQVVLRLASGKITLMKTMITSIERSGASASSGATAGGAKAPTGGLVAFLDGREIPPGFEDLVEELKQLCRKRDEMAAIDATNVKLEASIKKLVGEVKKIEKADAENARKISRAAPAANPIAYSKLVDGANVVRQNLNQKRAELYEAQNSRRGAMPQVSEYVGSIDRFEQTLTAVQAESAEAQAMRKDIRGVLDKLEQEVRVVPMDPASSVEIKLLDAKVNDRATGKFFVDASMSYVAVSRTFAKRLGVHVPGLQESTVTDAEGKQVKLRVMLLDSLQIGETKLPGMDCVVLDKMPRNDLDGVIGTNALGFFAVYVDPATKGLVIKDYRAKPGLVGGASRD